MTQKKQNQKKRHRLDRYIRMRDYTDCYTSFIYDVCSYTSLYFFMK